MNDLERIFRQNEGRLIHKWIHYFEIYDRYFSPFRGRDIRVLEIGVFHGGSLQMWKQYFGEQALIVGMDINPRVEALGEAGIEIVVGDQSDPDFLRSVVDRFGPFDIVIDDGSHVPAHQIASIEHLWPTLPEDALYVVEDLHTNYWEHFGGGKGADDTFFEWLRERMDDIHAFHSREDHFVPNAWTRTLRAIHVYDSVAVLERSSIQAPTHERTGQPSFPD